MIDKDLVENGVTVLEALDNLRNSGIIQHQIQRERDRVLQGDADASLEEVALQVLQYRSKTQHLQALLELCEYASKEINHA